MTVRLSTGKIKARLAPLATAFIDITVCDLGSSERTCIRRHKGNKEGLVQYISTYAGYQYTDVFTWYLVHNILTLRLRFPAQLLWSEVLPSAAFWASCVSQVHVVRSPPRYKHAFRFYRAERFSVPAARRFASNVIPADALALSATEQD